MSTTNNKTTTPTVFFSRISHWLLPKNNLQKSVIEMLKDKYNRRIYTSDAVPGIIKSIRKDIKALETLHLRCKPLAITEQPTGDNDMDLQVYDSNLFTLTFYATHANWSLKDSIETTLLDIIHNTESLS